MTDPTIARHALTATRRNSNASNTELVISQTEDAPAPLALGRKIARSQPADRSPKANTEISEEAEIASARKAGEE